jgi:hypothetical protein
MWFWTKRRAVRDLRVAVYEQGMERQRETDTKQWWTDFQAEVESVLGEFLGAHEFHDDEFQREKYKVSWYFTSAACKICFYDDIRNGDVNCMLAKLGAPNTTCENDGWQPFRRLLRLAGVELRTEPRPIETTRKEYLQEIEQLLGAHWEPILNQLNKL